MQGQLRNENLQARIDTQCTHCGQPIQFELDSQLNIHVLTPGADPLGFIPMVDFARLEDPSIIDAF